MRRVATGLLAASLLVLALAAAVDVLRGGNEQPTQLRPAKPESSPADDLRAAGAGGTITYSDAECRLHAFRLPGLDPAPAPRFKRCEPHIPNRGLATWRGDVVWSGLGFHTVQVVLSRRELGAIVRGDPQARQLTFGGAGRWEATQLVALGADRYAVVLDHGRSPWERLLAVFEGRRMLSLRVSLVGPDDFVRPSTTGRYFALIRPDAVRVFETEGGETPLPNASSPHAVAWSPDDRWTALATRYSIYVFPSERPDETIRIPLAVRDLDWGT